MGVLMPSLNRSLTKRWRQIMARWRIVFLVFVLLLSLHYILSSKCALIRHAHTITPASIALASSLDLSRQLSPEIAQEICQLHRFSPYSATSPKRKIYDAFLFDNELDWLEIRLETLSTAVDYFIIVESALTFTSLDKPLFLKENWSRFKKFHHKIIHHVLTDEPKDAKTTWDVERYQRNALFEQVFPYLNDKQAARIGDIIVVSDVDEIPRPISMLIVRNCDIPKRVTFWSQFYYYGFQFMHRGEQWSHGQATVFGGLEPGQTILPEDLRMESQHIRNWWHSTNIWNAGWHCSSCFKTVDEVLNKMASFSHTSLNRDDFRDKARIIDRVRKGLDLWDRPGQIYDRLENNEDVPEFIKKDRTRWRYLLDREGEDAGFRDV